MRIRTGVLKDCRCFLSMIKLYYQWLADQISCRIRAADSGLRPLQCHVDNLGEIDRLTKKGEGKWRAAFQCVLLNFIEGRRCLLRVS